MIFIDSRAGNPDIPCVMVRSFSNRIKKLSTYKYFCFEILHNLKLGNSKLIKDAACSRLCSDSKTSLSVVTKSGRSKLFKQIC